jgi:hypothetical protein
LFAETAGHPVLTVNVLTILFDWLIEEKRPISRLRLQGPDFEEFAAKHLTPRAISMSREYELLRRLARYGLSDQCRADAPWLYAVFQVLRLLGSQPNGKMTCSISQAQDLLDRLGLTSALGMDAVQIVRDAQMANFLELRDPSVRPAVRLLARLTATVPSSAAP